MRILVITFFLLSICSLEAQELPKRFHKVSDVVYRSSQPSKKEFKSLEELGVAYSINLRYRIDDRRRLKGTSLMQKRYRMKTKEIQLREVIEVLKFIHNSESPVVIHCLHGSDRTGCIVAFYRMVEQDWTKAQAIDELRNELHSYNEKWFPNIVELIEDSDIEFVKDEVLKGE